MDDVFSWGDSSPAEPFDDDSWMSEPESICNNWRGWKKPTTNSSENDNIYHAGNVLSVNHDGPTATSSLSNAHHHHHPHNALHQHPPMSTNRPNSEEDNENYARNQHTFYADGASPPSSSPLNAQANENSSINSPFVMDHHGSSMQDHTGHGGANNNKNVAYVNKCCGVPSLLELTARVVAHNMSFEVVERVCSPVPEQIQLRIANWSFPDNEEDIRLYSCLANGSADEFQKGESLYRLGAIRNPLQIGFHLSAEVTPPTLKYFRVAVTFDRCRITSCSCTCVSPSSWCAHVVAVCLHRIYRAQSVRLRAPVSESLTRLTRNQLQKFAQHLISESPQQILPTAQRLLDDLLMNKDSQINKQNGAPDPTAGAPASEQTKWCLDELQLHENIRKIVIKLCIPSPMVYSDVNYLSSAAPPAAAEWSSLLRPLRGREPEGLWNLLSIVREMLRRHDRNAIPLLRILTEEILSCDQILLWWFTTNVSLHKGYPTNSSQNGQNGAPGGQSNNRSVHSNYYASQHACCSLCDEIVVLWRLVTLNPAHSYSDTQTLYVQLKNYHLKTLQVIRQFRPEAVLLNVLNNLQASSCSSSSYKTSTISTSSTNNSSAAKSDLEVFSGFKPAMVSCLIDWDSYPIPGVTHQRNSSHHRRYYEPSLHDQFNSVNHNITSTCISNPQILEHPSAINSIYQPQQQLQQVANNNNNPNDNPNNNDNNNSNEERKFKQSNKATNEPDEDEPKATVNPTPGRQRGNSNESEDSGNQEFWDRDSIASSEEDNNGNDSSNNRNENPQRDRLSSETSNQSSSSSPSPPSQQQQPIEQEFDESLLFYDYAYDNQLGTSIKLRNKQNGTGGDANLDPTKSQYQLIKASMVKPMEDSFEILFARAEALYAHGYVEEAAKLSVKLAEELLNNPPDLQMDLSSVSSNLFDPTTTPNSSSMAGPSTSSSSSACLNNNGRSSHNSKRLNRNRFNPALHRISLLTSATLSKAAFLCQVLSEHERSHLLAFHVGLLGIELVRPPASTKALEVKLAHQEQELVNLLKRIPLCQQSWNVLRKKAEQLRDGRLTTRGEALLPLSLASYIFEALILMSNYYVLPGYSTDERLVFDAAVAAIGLKAKVSEAEHPLLCEGTRRQRGDLALNLLIRYKDNKERLDMIMEKLLDQDIHPIFKKQSSSLMLSPYYPTNMPASSSTIIESSSVTQKKACNSTNRASQSNVKDQEEEASTSTSEPNKQQQQDETQQTNSVSSCWNVDKLSEDIENKLNIENRNSAATDTSSQLADSAASDTTQASSTAHSDKSGTVCRRKSNHSLDAASGGSSTNENNSTISSSSSSSSDSFSESENKNNNNNNTITNNNSTKDQTVSEEQNGTIDGQQTTNDGNTERQQMCDITNNSECQSVNRMTSNSWKTAQPATSSTSSNGSTCKVPCGSSVPLSLAMHSTSYMTPSGYHAVNCNGKIYNPTSYMMMHPPNGAASTASCSSANPSITAIKQLRCRGKRHYPVIPNQPSEASAHFMFELAKTLLAKAGGNNTTVLFTQPPSAQNSRAPHRLLHMCAFQIGLYALGLHNAVSPNWLSRTYSSHVSWITCQAMEIGHQAIEFLIETWEGHLTPSEVASLADRASRSQESLMVKAAAELALSCLPHAHALSPSEIQRALVQCKEQSTCMLERACLAVEQAAQGGGVYPEVLFDVARNWHRLASAEKSSNDSAPQQSSSGSFYSGDESSGTESQAPSSNNKTCKKSKMGSPATCNTTNKNRQHQSSSSSSSMFMEDGFAANGTVSLVEPNTSNGQSSAVFNGYIDPTSIGPYGYQVVPMVAPTAVTSYAQSEYSLQYTFYHGAHRHYQQPQRGVNGSGAYNKQGQSASYWHYHQAFPPGGHPQQQPGARIMFDNSTRTYVPVVTGNATPYPAAIIAYPTHASAAAVRAAGNGGGGAYYAGQVASTTAAAGSSGYSVGGSSNSYYSSPLIAGASSGGPNPYAYMMNPPIRTQYGFVAPAGQPTMLASGTPANFTAPGQLQLLSMEQLAQYQSSPSSNGSTGTAVTASLYGTHHLHQTGLDHHHHHQMMHPIALPPPQTSSIFGPKQLNYMHAAYRVGMLAMETLARRVNDDRPQVKYARNPPYGEDVKWLLWIAKQLGAQYVQEFCICTLTAVASPFVLFEIIHESAESMLQPGSNNAAYIQSIQSQILNPLIQKCKQTFGACIYFQIAHITSSDYDEFISTLHIARAAFHMTPEGHGTFKNILQSLRRTRTCKKELWQQISNEFKDHTSNEFKTINDFL